MNLPLKAFSTIVAYQGKYSRLIHGYVSIFNSPAFVAFFVVKIGTAVTNLFGIMMVMFAVQIFVGTRHD